MKLPLPGRADRTEGRAELREGKVERIEIFPVAETHLLVLMKIAMAQRLKLASPSENEEGRHTDATID
eukprot:6184644-Pleurochrysis_carterae.AAC.2